jgi:hypothetical protein
MAVQRMGMFGMSAKKMKELTGKDSQNMIWFVL